MLKSVILIFLCSIFVMPSSILTETRTCGSDLNDRVSRICQPRGGYRRHSNHSRSKRNIVQECCWHACPDSNIYYYCSNQNVLAHSPQQSLNDEVTSAMMPKQNDEDLVTEKSVMSTNLDFFKSRQYGTISPEFRKGAIYVG